MQKEKWKKNHISKKVDEKDVAEILTNPLYFNKSLLKYLYELKHGYLITVFYSKKC